MSTPNDALHAALIARPQQTARELALALAVAGHPGLTEAEVEQVLARATRGSGTTAARRRGGARWAPATRRRILHLPTPHHPAPQVLAPASVLRPAGRARRLRAAGHAARDPARGRVRGPAVGPAPGRRRACADGHGRPRPARGAPPIPVRVPVIARLAAIDPPPAAVPARRTPLSPTPPALPDRVRSPPPRCRTGRSDRLRPRRRDDPGTPDHAPRRPDRRAGRPVAPVEPSHPSPRTVAPPPRRPTVAPLPAPAAPPTADRSPLPPGGEVRYVGPQLRRWQKDVLDAWLAAGRRGIVEAVSAQGRGVVGVLATWDALTRGEKVLVLVPTTDLLEQWLTDADGPAARPVARASRPHDRPHVRRVRRAGVAGQQRVRARPPGGPGGPARRGRGAQVRLGAAGGDAARRVRRPARPDVVDRTPGRRGRRGPAALLRHGARRLRPAPRPRGGRARAVPARARPGGPRPRRPGGVRRAVRADHGAARSVSPRTAAPRPRSSTTRSGCRAAGGRTRAPPPTPARGCAR